ncbi:alpha-crystallin B chain-like [Oppia nitens]|uniref:alpha-crystallin B chain-like n=1 Tax=Oppia nitens TaxID=1686743 RepID=UPI0023DC7008|nr:alpha-crystallin B chain-like [Oppia nitens]
MSRNVMPFFNRWDWDTSRAFESHFGQNLMDDDFFAPMALTPNYYVRRRPFGRQLSSGLRSPMQLQSQEVVPIVDKFQVMVDVSHFAPEEITVKTMENTVVVTARHEDRADDFGYISRQFSRKYTLPPDVDPLAVTSSLSSEGILTVQAPRKLPELKEGERAVPITMVETPKPKEITVLNETPPQQQQTPSQPQQQ